MNHKIDNANNWSGTGDIMEQIISELNDRYDNHTQGDYTIFYSRLSENPDIIMDTVQIAVKFYLHKGQIFESQTRPFVLKY